MATFAKSVRGAWKAQGYLVLEQVLSTSEVRRLLGDVERLRRDSRRRAALTHETDAHWESRNIVDESAAFRSLIDHRYTFNLIVALLGPFIQLGMAQAHVRATNLRFGGYIHTDGGVMNRVRMVRGGVPLQLKVEYFLTDLLQSNSGNFVCVPGTHRTPLPEGRAVSVRSRGAVQLRVRAGDAVVFDSALWHGAAPNRRRAERKSLIYGYQQMFLRPYDYDVPSQVLLTRCTPRQRRLVGDLGSGAQPWNHYYPPTDHVAVVESADGPRKERRQNR
jgi:ectoine hydroxylase-related dioxygenase (phytanoyl-CoA dioxygenase family)